MRSLWRTGAYAVRNLLRRPYILTLCVFSLAVGISANALLFGLIDALILRRLPVSHPEELVKVSTVSPRGAVGDDRVQLSMFQALKERSHVFAEMFAWNDDALRNMQSGNVRYLGEVNEVSADFFRTLDQQPFLGRWINEDEINLASGQSARVAVLSHRCWRERYGSDSQVLGKIIIVDDIPLAIIGVTNENFAEIDIDITSDAFVPINALNEDRNGWYNVTSRLKKGETLNHARAEVESLWPNILADTAAPSSDPDVRRQDLARRIRLTSESRGDSSLREKFSRPLIIVMGLAVIILLITCVNLGYVTLARTISRIPELRLRLALGASYWHVLQLVLWEAFLIALAGSFVGTGLALWSEHLIIKLFWTGFVAPGLRVRVDLPVLVFMVGAAFLTSILFGLAPAIRATFVSPSPAAAYKGGSIKGTFALAKILITSQVILAFVLSWAALRFAGTLYHAMSVDVGYDRRNVLVITLFRQSERESIPNNSAYYQELTRVLKNMPGAESVSYAQSVPAFNFEAMESITASKSTAHALYDFVGPDFFRLLKIPVVKGREFLWHDDQASPRVAILSESLASRLFPGEDPVGKQVNFGQKDEGKALTIVGVVRDASLWKPNMQHPIAIFMPLIQACPDCIPLALIKTKSDPITLTRVSERAVESMGYQYSARTLSLEDKFDKVLATEHLLASLSVTFGGTALLLTCLGLYGLVSYIVQIRHRETAIRIAVGADRPAIALQFLKETFLILAAGTLIGSCAALGTSRALSSQFEDIGQFSLSQMLWASIIVLLTGLLAGFLPAIRASRTDPAAALKVE